MEEISDQFLGNSCHGFEGEPVESFLHIIQDVVLLAETVEENKLVHGHEYAPGEVIAEIAFECIRLTLKHGHILGELVELLAILLYVALDCPFEHPATLLHFVSMLL